MDKNKYTELLKNDVPPVTIGNKNKSGKCGMCEMKSKKLFYRKVGSIEFMICERCKSIMDM